MGAAGLRIESLLEPAIDESVVQEDPSEERWRRLPLYLFVTAVKTE